MIEWAIRICRTCRTVYDSDDQFQNCVECGTYIGTGDDAYDSAYAEAEGTPLR